MDLTNFTLTPATLLVLIFGLVEFVKSLGVQGNRLRWVSMGLGIGLAGLYRLRELLPLYGASPTWAAWIELGFFGLAAGLAACGVYDFLHRQAKSMRPPSGLIRLEQPYRPAPRDRRNSK